MRNIGYYHSVLNGRIEIKLWSGRFLSFFSFLIKLLYIIHQKTPRTVKKKTEAPQVDVEGLSFPSYFRYSFFLLLYKQSHVTDNFLSQNDRMIPVAYRLSQNPFFFFRLCYCIYNARRIEIST